MVYQRRSPAAGSGEPDAAGQPLTDRLTDPLFSLDARENKHPISSDTSCYRDSIPLELTGSSLNHQSQVSSKVL